MWCGSLAQGMISEDMKEPVHRPIVRCECRRQWRDWLAGHFESEYEVWFVFPTKDSGEEGVSYNDAVEEALCFGRTSRGLSGWMRTG